MTDKNTQKQTVIKITNIDRVHRILSKLCNAKMRVYIRTKEEPKILVKGHALLIVAGKDQNSGTFIIDNLSERATKFLKNKSSVRIEFVMLSNKLVFLSKIQEIQNGKIVIQSPDSIFSLERRLQSRHAISGQQTAFVELSVLDKSKHNLTRMPVILPYQGLDNRLKLHDISLSGVCLSTPYPFILTQIEQELIDPKAKLILPMQFPHLIGLKFHWIKKIVFDPDFEEDSDFGPYPCYRIGCEFINLKPQVAGIIKAFIQTINSLEAI